VAQALLPGCLRRGYSLRTERGRAAANWPTPGPTHIAHHTGLLHLPQSVYIGHCACDEMSPTFGRP
jgi:hypothetical protein